EQLAVRKGYYQPDGVDAHVMRLEIPPRRTTFAAPDPTAASSPAPSTPHSTPATHHPPPQDVAAPETVSPLPVSRPRGDGIGRAGRGDRGRLPGQGTEPGAGE